MDQVPLVLNRATAIGLLVEGELDQVQWAGVDDGRIASLRIMRRPDELAQRVPRSSQRGPDRT